MLTCKWCLDGRPNLCEGPTCANHKHVARVVHRAIKVQARSPRKERKKVAVSRVYGPPVPRGRNYKPTGEPVGRPAGSLKRLSEGQLAVAELIVMGVPVMRAARDCGMTWNEARTVQAHLKVLEGAA